MLGSKLDTDIHKNICRLAFDGKLLHSFTDKDYQTTELSKLRIYKNKKKEGQVERCVNDYEVVAKNMFKKETNIHLFEGLKVTLSTGETGKIDGPFGQSGKFKISLDCKFRQYKSCFQKLSKDIYFHRSHQRRSQNVS